MRLASMNVLLHGTDKQTIALCVMSQAIIFNGELSQCERRLGAGRHRCMRLRQLPVDRVAWPPWLQVATYIFIVVVLANVHTGGHCALLVRRQRCKQQLHTSVPIPVRCSWVTLSIHRGMLPPAESFWVCLHYYISRQLAAAGVSLVTSGAAHHLQTGRPDLQDTSDICAGISQSTHHDTK